VKLTLSVGEITESHPSAKLGSTPAVGGRTRILAVLSLAGAAQTELKSTAGGPAKAAAAARFIEESYCTEAVPPNSFKLGSGLFYISSSLTPKTTVALSTSSP